MLGQRREADDDDAAADQRQRGERSAEAAQEAQGRREARAGRFVRWEVQAQVQSEIGGPAEHCSIRDAVVLNMPTQMTEQGEGAEMCGAGRREEASQGAFHLDVPLSHQGVRGALPDGPSLVVVVDGRENGVSVEQDVFDDADKRGRWSLP